MWLKTFQKRCGGTWPETIIHIVISTRCRSTLKCIILKLYTVHFVIRTNSSVVHVLHLWCTQLHYLWPSIAWDGLWQWNSSKAECGRWTRGCRRRSSSSMTIPISTSLSFSKLILEQEKSKDNLFHYLHLKKNGNLN